MGYTVVLDGKRACISCKAVHPITEFYVYPYTTKQGKRSVRTDSRCKSCARDRRKAHYYENSVASRETAIRYKRKHRGVLNKRVEIYRLANRELVLAQRRASQAKRKAQVIATATGADVMQILEEARIGDAYLDAYTGELINDPTIDHIEPLSRGGSHDYWNMCVTSLSNNSTKHARPLLTWLALR